MASSLQKSSAESGIIVDINSECKLVRFNHNKLKSILAKTCLRFNVCLSHISLTVVGNAGIRKINRKFLKKNRITDVISFDLSDDTCNDRLFDIAINAEMAKKQAAQRGVRAESELALYALHGVLHNLGFDDSTPTKAKKMHAAEDEILQEFGYGIVYNGNRNG